MAKNRHHYVPRFYLRNFGSGSAGQDVINMYHLDHKFAKRDVGLKGQCFRWKFYGETDDLEDLLSKYENVIAPLLRRVISGNKLPEEAIRALSFHRFIALQLLRNPGQLDRLSEMQRNMLATVEPKASKYGQQLELDAPVPDVQYLLALWPTITDLISDMGIRLLINKTAIGFLTSDNPAVKYNKYCEGIKGIGVYGYLSAGLLIFLPISPKHMIFLYDKTAYTVSGQGSPTITTLDIRDIECLNTLQAVNAEEKLLFADWNDMPRVETVEKKARRFRGKSRTCVVEAFADDNPSRNSIVHTFDRNINLGIALSFLGIRKDARRLSIEERSILYRQTHPQGAETNRMRREGSGGETRRFSVRKPTDK